MTDGVCITTRVMESLPQPAGFWFLCPQCVCAPSFFTLILTPPCPSHSLSIYPSIQLPTHPPAGDVMPSGHEGEMYAGGVRIVVHPIIQAAGQNADKVRCV